MVITVMSVATPMVSPISVKTLRSLCARKASRLCVMLSRSASIQMSSNTLDALPLLADSESADSARSHVQRQGGGALSVDGQRARFDETFGFTSGGRKTGCR